VHSFINIADSIITGLVVLAAVSENTKYGKASFEACSMHRAILFINVLSKREQLNEANSSSPLTALQQTGASLVSLS